MQEKPLLLLHTTKLYVVLKYYF